MISSHIVSDLEKLCDYICFIHEGKVLFSEEKDLLQEKYGLYQCSEEQLAELDAAAVKGTRRNGSYGLEALVERRLAPGNLPLKTPSIEDIIVYVGKGGMKL